MQSTSFNNLIPSLISKRHKRVIQLCTNKYWCFLRNIKNTIESSSKANEGQSLSCAGVQGRHQSFTTTLLHFQVSNSKDPPSNLTKASKVDLPNFSFFFQQRLSRHSWASSMGSSPCKSPQDTKINSREAGQTLGLQVDKEPCCKARRVPWRRWRRRWSGGRPEGIGGFECGLRCVRRTGRMGRGSNLSASRMANE